MSVVTPEQRAFMEKLLEEVEEACDEACCRRLMEEEDWHEHDAATAARRAEFERLFPLTDNGRTPTTTP